MTDSMWKSVQYFVNENEMLNVENAIKLKQILDLEEILYGTAVMETLDGSPCWCCMDAIGLDHDEYCIKAREATKHLWSKPK